jgi:hypothetical protein
VRLSMGRHGVIKREITGSEDCYFDYCIESGDGRSWWATKDSIRELSLLEQLADTAG